MYSGSQAEVQANNRTAEEAPGGHHPFSPYCQVYWEESTAVAVLDKWEFFHFVPMGKRTFCIRMEVHGEHFTRGLNTVSMKEGIASTVLWELKESVTAAKTTRQTYH